MESIAGSVVGGLASFATTYFTKRNHGHRDLLARDVARREELNSQFIKEATNLYVDSLHKTLENPGSLIEMYSLVGRMRLIAGDKVLLTAEKIAEPLLIPIDILQEHLRTHTSSLTKVALIRSRSSFGPAEKSEWSCSIVYSGVPAEVSPLVTVSAVPA